MHGSSTVNFCKALYKKGLLAEREASSDAVNCKYTGSEERKAEITGKSGRSWKNDSRNKPSG
ncbi:MAG: hypothetical protein ACFFD4_18300 [Candidatus Odinarchaeota archaeon]